MRQLSGLTFALVLAACGGVPSASSATAGTASAASSSGAAATTAAAVGTDSLVVEGDDATRIVDPLSGTTLARLPGGVLSPGGDLLVRVDSDPYTTRILGFDLDGRQVVGAELAGDYRLPSAYGAAPSGFSPNGAWLALVAHDTTESRFAIVDVAKGRVAQTVTLAPRFTFDAIHNDGSAMYLIEHPVPGSTSYNVRLYDLAAKVLRPDIIFDKSAIAQFDPTVGLMDGTFHVSVAPKAGDWSFGLYMRPNGSPFVHALNVPGHYATCIVDLAGVWTGSSRFSMALRDDGRLLYVIDPGMGTATTIDAATQKVTGRATFAGRGGDGNFTTSAVVSHDGARIYASGARGVAMLRASDLSFSGWAVGDLAVRSLAITRDGTRLYALTTDAIVAIDPVSGRLLSQLPSSPGARAIHIVAVR